jgi:hypothetical protein
MQVKWYSHKTREVYLYHEQLSSLWADTELLFKKKGR